MTDARLDAIRARIERLRERDEAHVVFGSATHEWQLAPAMPRDELAELERRHGVTFPDELRTWLVEVAAAGAGPYYGLLDARTTTADLAGTWIGELPKPELDDPSLHRGHLVLAEQGCGYRSVLVLTGAQRGEVFADMRAELDGFHREAPSFLAWYEDWLDRALAEWAAEELPHLIDGGEWERDEDIDAAAPILDRADASTPRTTHDVLYPQSDVKRLVPVMLLRVYQRRFDDALALIDRIRGVDDRDAAAQAQLATARIHGVRGDHAARLAAAEQGLADRSCWFSTQSQLHAEKARALSALGRRRDATAALLDRARLSADRNDFFDAAWHALDDDASSAAAILIEGARTKKLEPLEFAAPLLEALLREDRAEAAQQLRAQLA